MRRRCRCSPAPWPRTGAAAAAPAGALRALPAPWSCAGLQQAVETPPLVQGCGGGRLSPGRRGARPWNGSVCSLCTAAPDQHTAQRRRGGCAPRAASEAEKCRTEGASWARAAARQVAQAAANAPAAADGVGQYLLLLPVVEALGEYERLLGRCRALNPVPTYTCHRAVFSISCCAQAASGRAPGRRRLAAADPPFARAQRRQRHVPGGAAQLHDNAASAAHRAAARRAERHGRAAGVQRRRGRALVRLPGPPVQGARGAPQGLAVAGPDWLGLQQSGRMASAHNLP